MRKGLLLLRLLDRSSRQIGGLGLLACMCMLHSAASAEDFTAGGIKYNIISEATMMASVTDNGEATGVIDIPATVTNNGTTYTVFEIEAQAFSGAGITDLTIPTSIMKIGDGAFSGCTGLKNVTFNAASCTYCGTKDLNAFSGCTALRNVTFGDEVTMIPDFTFQNLPLRSLFIPRKVAYIGDTAFANCPSITNIVIDAENLGSANWSFAGCSGEMNVTFTDNVVVIPENIFSNSYGITSLTIGENVEKIGDGAFYIEASRQKNLKTIFYNSKNKVSNRSVFGNQSPTTLTIGDNVTYVPSIFEYCPFNVIKFGNKVEEIEDRALRSSHIAVFNAPKTLKRIGVDVFSADLTKAVLNEGLEYLSGFRGSKITSITIPSTVTEIGEGAFPTSLTEISGLDNPAITKIGKSAFDGCTLLKGSLKIGPNVTEIDERAFYQCTGFTGELSLGNNVTSVGTSAFDGCTGFTKLTLNQKLVNIGKYAFSNIYNRKGEFVLPESVQNIGLYAFHNCNISGTLVLGENIKSIYGNAFTTNAITKLVFNCYEASFDTQNNNYNINSPFAGTKINQIEFGPKVTSIDSHMFSGLTSLEELEIPASITSIGWRAFRDCTNLRKVSLSEGLKSIGEEAFYSCSELTEITIPSSVRNIGSSAFAYCTHLADLTILAKEIDGGYGISYPWLKRITLGEELSVFNMYLFNNVTSELESVRWDAKRIKSIVDNNTGTHSKAACPVVLAEGVEAFYPGVFSTVISNAVNVPVITGDAPAGANAYVPNKDTYSADSKWKGYRLHQSVTWSGTTDGETLKYTTDFPYELTLNKYLDASGNTVEGTPKNVGDYTAVFDYEISGRPFQLISHFSITPNTANTMAADDVRAYRKKPFELVINMTNKKEITAFQFNLELPQGMTVSRDEYGDYEVALTSRKSGSHTLESSMLPDGSLNVICASMSNQLFSGNEGAIVTVKVDVTADALTGDQLINLTNIRMTTPGEEEILTSRTQSHVLVSDLLAGDVNDDGIITVTDAVIVVNHILGKAVTEFTEFVGDMNGDGKITVSDAVSIMNLSISGNTPAKRNAPQIVAYAGEDNYMSIPSMDMNAGEEYTYNVEMTNADPVTACQFDIHLPQGVTVQRDAVGEPIVALSDARTTNSHMVSSAMVDDNTLRVVALSTKSRPFKGNSGSLVEIKLLAGTEMPDAECTIKIDGIEMTNPDATAYHTDGCSAVLNVTSIETPITSPDADGALRISAADGRIVLAAGAPTYVSVSSMSGSSIHSGTIPAGETVIAVPAGVYVVNGKKILVK